METEEFADEAQPAPRSPAASGTGLGPARARSSYRPPASGYDSNILHDDDALALALEEETRRRTSAPAHTPSQAFDISDEELVRMITEDMAAHGSTIGAIEQLEEVLAVRAATAGIPVQSDPASADVASVDPPSPESPFSEPPFSEASSLEAPSLEVPSFEAPSFDSVIAPRGESPRETSVRRVRTGWIWLVAVLVALAAAAAVAAFGFGLGR